MTSAAKGWNRFRELEEAGPKSDQAFVAMWFDDCMDEPYDKAVKPALEETGYQPLCMKYVRHGGMIDNRIMAEIRRSGLVLADFTEQRQSVYYEAGFAEGRGIPVVRSCHEKQVEPGGRSQFHPFR